jgi:hypothetical protein
MALCAVPGTLDRLLAMCIATGEVQPCPIVEALVSDAV